MCGGSYPVLTLLSSRIFGKEFFNTGLTSYELRKLNSIKIFSTIILENLPQLICQILYIIISSGIPSSSTILAFIASILSILSAILSYCLYNKNDNNCIVIEYDLEMIIKNKKNNINLTQKERKWIYKKKERKKSLKRLLCPSLQISQSLLELGYVTLTRTGCIIHCIHFTFKNEINEIINDINSDEHKIDDKYNNSLIFCKKLYVLYNDEIIESFSKQFGFKKNEIKIKFHNKYYLNIFNKNDNSSINNIINLIKKIDSNLNTNDDENNKNKILYSKLINDGYDKETIMLAYKLVSKVMLSLLSLHIHIYI